ncbi:MAG: bifunctional 23S rRNA (guanine(2069)-N(7))-methyltransferase RlmK/23S rRNA (guanine(2445)-N(2))-methyltransferase RlmL [Collinsella sp.]|nr:bifunctional 23S rRNA (guanine(2069)-N(7))-methyltransferase RlmK/23S rRNA (guanine(2445)-N(2))-methyltransferase RlmL [Collinsella sp.]
MDTKTYLEFFASCPEGFEPSLETELANMGIRKIRRLKGRISFTGTVADAYRACLWSRLASRVFVVVGRFDCGNANELYDGAYDMPWEDIIAPRASIAISARGTNPELRNSHYAALCVKDAVCDRLADETGARADVDTDDPDVRLLLSIRGDRASISLDLSGEALFKRLPREATRTSTGAHVLRPDYAALLLAQAGWAEACRDAGTEGRGAALVDICCAGGGIVLEAACQLIDRAPGLTRERWGFEGWGRHEPETWDELLAEADERAVAGRQRAAKIVATDPDAAAVAFAQRVLRSAGLAQRVSFVDPASGSLSALLEGHTIAAVVADTTEVPFTQMGTMLSLMEQSRDPSSATGSSPFVVLTRDDLVQRAMGVRPQACITVMPNNEEARILAFPDATSEAADHAAPRTAAPAHSVDLGDGSPVPVLVAESDQFAARLRKVARLRRKWAKRTGVTCYRVYDADLPDYAAAIDLYQGGPKTPGRWLVIAEYAAPKSIDPAVAQARLLDILAIAPRILEVEPQNVFTKARTRSRGGSQYANAGKGTFAATGSDPALRPIIHEGGLAFEVAFDGHLDTGIFLDHRVTRELVRERARGKRRFLNLFAYTGTATCYAADGGIEETVTVDLSNTYLDWAERNMRRNGFGGREHEFVRADVLRWIREQRETRNRWDLIFCDPPTFSNSAKMGRRTWDVQRDHVDLIVGISRLLTREGEAIFSCNLRTFRPDVRELARAGVVLTDISERTIPDDFARNKRIHKCYIVKRYEIERAMELAGMGEDEIERRREELSGGGGTGRGKPRSPRSSRS